MRVSGSLNTSRGGTAGTQRYQDGYGCRRYDCPNAYDTRRGSSLRVNMWTADADLMFEPLRIFPVGRALLLGFSPYAFGGVGYYAARSAGARDTGLTTVNYGLGVRHELVGWLGVAAEARFRRALKGDSTVLTFNRHNAQYRVGFTVSFGGRRAARKAPPVAVATPVPVPAPAPVVAPVAGTVAITPGASMAAVNAHVVPRVLDLADGYVGTPYLSGGASPTAGFDAAGFVQYVFGREGVELSRTVQQLARAGMTVSTRAGSLRPGDLLFFSNDGVTPDHVAIYAGRDRIVHATASAGAVRYDVLGEGARGAWFAAHLVAPRRVVDGDDAPRPRAPGRRRGAPRGRRVGPPRPGPAPAAGSAR